MFFLWMALFLQANIPDQIAPLLVESAAAAWLTKGVVDLVRQRTGLAAGYTLLLAAVLAVAFTAAWGLYSGSLQLDLPGYATLVLRSVLAFLGAIAVTEIQKAATRMRASRSL